MKKEKVISFQGSAANGSENLELKKLYVDFAFELLML